MAAKSIPVSTSDARLMTTKEVGDTRLTRIHMPASVAKARRLCVRRSTTLDHHLALREPEYARRGKQQSGRPTCLERQPAEDLHATALTEPDVRGHLDKPGPGQQHDDVPRPVREEH